MNTDAELVQTGYGRSTGGTVSLPEAVTFIQRLDLPGEVIVLAVQYYLGLESENGRQPSPKGLRARRKLRRIFLCVMMALNSVGHPRDPEVVANMVGLPSSEIEQAFNDSSVDLVIDPIALSRFYVHELNLLLEQRNLPVRLLPDAVANDLQRILHVCQAKPQGRELLQNNPAKNVCIGTLTFYLYDVQRLTNSVPRDLIERACRLSWACINKHQKQIESLYNA